MWRGLFYQEMAEKIRELASRGYLLVIDRAVPERQYQGSNASPL
jgi:hypothetical protein